MYFYINIGVVFYILLDYVVIIIAKKRKILIFDCYDSLYCIAFRIFKCQSSYYQNHIINVSIYTWPTIMMLVMKIELEDAINNR